MPAELKPCPFCGGKARMMVSVDTNGYMVECEKYCCVQTFSNREYAAQKWNQRANIKE